MTTCAHSAAARPHAELSSSTTAKWSMNREPNPNCVTIRNEPDIGSRSWMFPKSAPISDNAPSRSRGSNTLSDEAPLSGGGSAMSWYAI